MLVMPSKKQIRKPGPKRAVKDSRAEFERLLSKTRSNQRYQLRLYITGTTTRSAQAIENIRSLCEEYLAGRYDLEVIDIYQQPGQAADQQIIAAPTLVKELPIPPKRLIGNLSDRDKIIVGLNLKAENAVTKPAAKKIQWAKL